MRRLTISVNSILRIRLRQLGPGRAALPTRTLRYFFFSRVVVPFGGLLELLLAPSRVRATPCETASICLRICFLRCSIFSSVISSSLKMTSSRTPRSSAFSSSPIVMIARAMVGVREIDLMTASLPRSMRLAISTSPSRVRRGTVPISRRYMRTGSLVLSRAPGVRSSSISSAPSPVRSSCFSSRNVFSESTTSMPGAAERTEQIIEILRRRDVGGEDLVDLVVQQVSLFLTDRDELFHLVVTFFDRQRHSCSLSYQLTTEPCTNHHSGARSEAARTHRRALTVKRLDALQKLFLPCPQSDRSRLRIEPRLLPAADRSRAARRRGRGRAAAASRP